MMSGSKVAVAASVCAASVTEARNVRSEPLQGAPVRVE
jgi:hypothetical protein